MSEKRSTTVCADLVLVNGQVITMNTNNPKAEAVAVRDGKIIMVGRDDEIEEAVGEETVKLDL